MDSRLENNQFIFTVIVELLTVESAEVTHDDKVLLNFDRLPQNPHLMFEVHVATLADREFTAKYPEWKLVIKKLWVEQGAGSEESKKE